MRTLTSADGSMIVERLEMQAAEAYRLGQSLLTDTPFRHCVTTMEVRDLGPSQAELASSMSFQPDGLPAGEAMALLEGALAANYLALNRFA